MTDIIVALPVADANWQEDPEQPGYNPQPQPSIEMARYNDGIDKVAYLATGDDASEWPSSAYIVGAWDEITGLQFGQTWSDDEPPVIEGSPVFPIQSDLNDYIRPLGNDNGVATGQLDSHKWQGHTSLKAQYEAEPYPVTNTPFTLRITRQYIEDPNPAWSGWGWRVDMLSDDPVRDITARGIGIYSDPEWTQYLYTTGAFVDDGSGNYFTECPVGQRTATPDPIYFALLLGAGQEGTWTHEDAEDGSTSERQFWSDIQGGLGVAGSAQSWIAQNCIVSEVVKDSRLCLQLADDGPWSMVKQAFPTVTGRQYIIEVDVHDGNQNINGIVGLYDGDREASFVNTLPDIAITDAPADTNWQPIDILFTAQSNMTTLCLSSTGGFTAWYTNLRARLML